MIFASLLSDVAGLGWLVGFVLAFIAAMVFREEIKGVLRRLTAFEWRGAKVSAEPPSETGKKQKPRAGTEAEPAEAPNEEGEAAEESALEETAANGEVKKPAADGGDEEPSTEDLRQQMFTHYLRGEQSAGDAAFARLQSLVTDAGEIKGDLARRRFGEYLAGIDSGALKELEGMVDDPEIGPYAERLVGLCLEHGGKKREAAEVLKSAAGREEKASNRSTAQEIRARLLSELGEADLAQSELRAALTAETVSDARETLLSGLAAVHNSSGEKDLQAIALHRLAEEAGNNASNWFKAGYAYSDAGLSRTRFHGDFDLPPIKRSRDSGVRRPVGSCCVGPRIQWG